MTEAPMVIRPELVGRLLAVIYPGGIPADQVDRLGSVVMHLNVAAEMALGAPLSATRPARFAGHAPSSLEGQPVADLRAPCVGVLTAQKGIDWDAEKRLGIISDHQLGELLGVTANSVRYQRLKRGKPPAAAETRRKPWGNTEHHPKPAASAATMVKPEGSVLRPEAPMSKASQAEAAAPKPKPVASSAAGTFSAEAFAEFQARGGKIHRITDEEREKAMAEKWERIRAGRVDESWRGQKKRQPVTP